MGYKNSLFVHYKKLQSLDNKGILEFEIINNAEFLIITC